jgi:DNA-binding LacI/PurR family transcriptional regulator
VQLETGTVNVHHVHEDPRQLVGQWPASLKQGIAQKLGSDRLGNEIRFFNHGASRIEAMRLAEEVLEGVQNSISGAILYHLADTTLVNMYRERGIPVVVVEPLVETMGIPCVVSDHFTGSYELTEYLLSLGHRNIGYVTFTVDSLAPTRRLEGHMACMEAHGVECDESSVLRILFWEDVVETSQQIADWLEARVPEMTAVRCVNDLVAELVYLAASERSIRIPDDLSVAGFDDYEIAQYTHPPLTTVKTFAESLGRHAVEMLVKLSDSSEDMCTGVVVGTELKVRGSCRQVGPSSPKEPRKKEGLEKELVS